MPTVIYYIKRAVKRLFVILNDADFEFAELLSGTSAFLWGAWIASPHWETFKASPTFNAMAELPLSENMQGGIIFLAGAVQVLGLAYNHLNTRKWGAFIVALIWIYVSTMFIRANITSTASVIYPLLALTAAWAYWRIAVKERG